MVTVRKCAHLSLPKKKKKNWQRQQSRLNTSLPMDRMLVRLAPVPSPTPRLAKLQRRASSIKINATEDGKTEATISVSCHPDVCSTPVGPRGSTKLSFCGTTTRTVRTMETALWFASQEAPPRRRRRHHHRLITSLPTDRTLVPPVPVPSPTPQLVKRQRRAS